TVAQENTYPVEADDTSRSGTAANQIVGNVARVVVHSPGVGVREDHRIAAVLKDVPGRPIACMAAAGDHADTGHLVQHLATERSKSGVICLTPTPSSIADVVGHQHPANAQIVVE